MKQNFKIYLSLFLLSCLILPFQNCGAFKAGVSTTDSASLAEPNPDGPGSSGTDPVVPTTPPDTSDNGRRILKVCASGCAYTKPSDAAANSVDNDIIEIQA